MLPPLVELWPPIDPDVCIPYREVRLLLWLTSTEEQTRKDTWGQATWKKPEQTYQIAVKSSRIIYNTSNNFFLRLGAFIAIIQYRVCIILTPDYKRFDSLSYSLVIITKAILGPASVCRGDMRKLQPVIPICKTSRFYLAPITYLAYLHWCINK